MLDFFMQIGSFIMTPLYYATSVVLVGFHKAIGTVIEPTSGWNWALSIIGLVLVVRILTIPLMVKQIKSSRNMQLLQPKVKELQKKYGHDRERLAQEQMKLFRETGTSPFASCLPLLINLPIGIALFRLINFAAKGKTHGILSHAEVLQFSKSEMFGVTIADTFAHGGGVNVKVLAGVLVVFMIVTMYITQRQLMRKNMPESAMTGQFAQQQKMLLYVLPLVFAVSGVAFPIGVLIYWATSNVWTMGQQFYVIRNNPAPNTEAEREKRRRDEAKARRKAQRRGEDPDAAVAAVREQPSSRPTNKKKRGSKPAAQSSESAAPEQADSGAGSGAGSGSAGSRGTSGSGGQSGTGGPRQRQQPKRMTREQRRKSSGPGR